MIMSIRKSEFTRPANGTAYVAGQMVTTNTAGGVAMRFASALPFRSMQGNLLKVLMIKSGTGVTNATFNLYLFNADPGTVNDAAALTLAYASRDTLAASVSLPACVVTTGGAITEFVPTSQTIPVATADVQTDLWGVLVATGAYTPTSAEQFSVRIYISPDQG